MNNILSLLNSPTIKEEIETIHNYINFNDLIIRKGAISSYKDKKMIIPFNMEEGILICKGKSNPEWNYSAPHGSGRKFSRSSAKKILSLENAKQEMKNAGVFSTEIPLDEVKGAYKSSTLIESLIEPTAEIVDRLKSIHNLKTK